MNSDIKYWVTFNKILGIGRVQLAQLESYFGSLGPAWWASPGEFKRAGLDSVALRAIFRWRDEISPNEEKAKLQKFGVRALTRINQDYPHRLKKIYDFPPVLYVRGTLQPEDDWSLAVVGTLRATVYDKQVTKKMVADLAHSRITIISSLDGRIDAFAHHSTLETGGRSLAMFACGLAAATVSGTLAMMKLKGLIKQVGAVNYILARELLREYRVRVD